MKHVNGCYKKMIPPKHEKLLEVHKYWITDSLDYQKFKHIHLVGGEHGCMDNWKYWIIGCPCYWNEVCTWCVTGGNHSSRIWGTAEKKYIILNSKFPGLDIHVVGRWLRMCTHIS